MSESFRVIESFLFLYKVDYVLTKPNKPKHL